MVMNNYQIKNMRPYRARNMMIKKSEVPSEQPAIDQMPESQPDTGQVAEQQPSEVGYINVGVFTASGALPVPDAVVTLYHTYETGEEHVLYHLVTDESGIIPTMEVPVEFQGADQQTEHYYSTYNLRIQADGYYPYNLLDIQVFPDIATNYRINMIPAAQGGVPNSPEQTFVIPKRPFESTVQ